MKEEVIEKKFKENSIAEAIALQFSSGIKRKLFFEIFDELAFYWFDNDKDTRKLVDILKEEGYLAKYREETKKTGCYYPKKSKEQIYDLIKSKLKEMGAKNG